MLNSPCELLAQTAGTLFKCEAIDGYTRIRTPFLYPDGDVIDLFLRDDGRFITLTDLGETVRWLNSQTVSKRRTDKQDRLLIDTCGTLGVEFFRGALNVHVTPESFSDDLTRLSQACLRVSDLWFTFRSRASENVTDEVADFLSEMNIPFERNKPFSGRSGNKWRIDFQTMAPNRSTLTQVLTTATPAAARRLAEHVLAQWHDLNHIAAAGPIRFVSLFDDTVDVWESEDFNLLADTSDVQMWSQREDFAQALGI
jgi:hypothetical protein